jgi:hypothetical protein
LLHREDFYFVDWFHVSAVHSNQGASGCEAHTNFADESACLMALYFTVSIVVHAWEFVYGMSAVVGSYQLQ